MRCLFVSDLHGLAPRYEKLFRVIEAEAPAAVFLGGDLLPSALYSAHSEDLSYRDFIETYLWGELASLRDRMEHAFPRIFVILGNDDVRFMEPSIMKVQQLGGWEYIHNKRADFERFQVYGYSCVPPTPFLLKDWERYDVSRYTDPGCVSPEEGIHSVAVSMTEITNGTIKDDLDKLAGEGDLKNAIFLFHVPPYNTMLDRAALDGKMIEHVPLDVHVGSIAMRRFIEARQPLLTLHGHVHESTRLTGFWRDRIGETYALSAAHDGSELALVRFDLEDLGSAARDLI